MTAEREVKLAVPPGFHLPQLNGDVEGVAAVPEEPRRIQTVYFDTDDLRIGRWGCSLRHRADQGWTVKLPPGLDGVLLVRDEHLFSGSASRPPKEALDLLTAYVRGAPVGAVARLSTVRTRVELRDPDGATIGEIVDDEVSVLEGRRVAARFREVEVEVSGSVAPQQLDALLAILHAAGAGDRSASTKYLQALGPRAARPPEPAPFALGDDPAAAEVVRLALTASAIRMLRHDAGVRLGSDPESVHQMRVATRRLRSDLRTYRSILDEDWCAGLREDLRWIGAELGEVRDTEVLGARMGEIARTLPAADQAVASRLLERLARHREEARRDLLSGMRATRYVDLLDRVVSAATAPEVTEEAARPARAVLPDIMEAPWRHLRTSADGLGKSSADAELHAVRIRAKRARYAAESMVPVYGKRAKAFAEAAAALQDVLGEHQDAVVAEQWLRDASSGASPRTSFVAGELAALERGASLRLRKAWPAAWKALARKRRRFWA